MAVFVNGNPIGRLSFFIRPVGIALVMLHVDTVVENLAEPDADRFEDTKKAVQEWRPEIGVVNEIVRDAVDVPGNADRIDQPED